MVTGMEKPYVVGMDIGGTNTVFGIVDSRGNVSVSYTHRDVYKRQAVCLSPLRPSHRHGQPTVPYRYSMPSHVSHPVSYTHLDVYKRQTSPWTM